MAIMAKAVMARGMGKVGRKDTRKKKNQKDPSDKGG